MLGLTIAGLLFATFAFWRLKALLVCFGLGTSLYLFVPKKINLVSMKSYRVLFVNSNM